MKQGGQAMRAAISLPPCIGRIADELERETGKAILYGVMTLQTAVEADHAERSVCPTTRIGEKGCYRIVRAAVRGQPLGKLPFDTCGVCFVGQAAGVVDTLRCGGLAADATKRLFTLLGMLARALSDPRIEPLRARLPHRLVPEDMRGAVELNEGIFPPLRIHFVDRPGRPPAVVWIDAVPYRDGGCGESRYTAEMRQSG